MSSQYGVTIEQAAGIIASLSPQKDWYQNVRLGELVLIAFRDNPVMTDQMVVRQEQVIKDSLKDPNKKLDSWKWDFGDGQYSNASNPTIIYPNSGIYTVSLAITTPQGCTGNDTVYDAIEVYSTPFAEFSYAPLTPSILFNTVDFIDKSLGVVNQWSWVFGDSLGFGNTNAPSFVFNEVGNYDVTLIVSTQYQCSDTIVKTIPVVNDYSFYIPKAFTPNDDGVNDILEMYGFNFSNFDFKIYNRHGQLVNEAVKNPLWDGRDLDGNFLPAGVYVYTIKLRETLNNKRHEYQGTVTLIR